MTIKKVFGAITLVALVGFSILLFMGELLQGKVKQKHFVWFIVEVFQS